MVASLWSLLVFVAVLSQSSSGLPNPSENDEEIRVHSGGNFDEKENDKVNQGDGKKPRDTVLRFHFEAKYKSWFLDQQRAKTIARITKGGRSLFRRGWSPKDIWGEAQEEEEESETRQTRDCQATCWAGWQDWSPCTTNCGLGGFRRRIRQIRPGKDCECPGLGYQDEECNRRCFNGGSPSSANSCSCAPGFTDQCCETRVMCGDPGAPQHGLVTPSGNSLPHGTTVYYSCNPGYRINTANPTRTCGENGAWTNGRPECLRIRCPVLNAPEHGNIVSNNDFEFESIVQYSCDVGYFRTGSETSTCQADGSWSDPTPTCAKGDCGDPGAPMHGSRTQLTDFSFNSVVRFQCDEGYVLVGAEERMCQADGQWSCAQPRCLTADSLLKRCPPLEPLMNGTITTSDGQLYKSVAEYSCHDGFYLTGHQHRVCQVNEEWSGVKPECTEIRCEPLTAPIHGEVNQSQGLVPFGEKATFSCHHGYLMEGDNERVCGGAGPVGIWFGIHPSCQAISCGAPNAPTNGRVIGYSFRYQDNVTVECGPGYYLHGSQILTCNRESSWVGNMDDSPICIECPLNEYSSNISSSTECLPCPENSRTEGTGSSDARQCVCIEGYRRNQESTQCEPITCELPQVQPNVVVPRACENSFGSSCEFECKRGYVKFVGHQLRTCSGQGEWSGEALQCIACPPNTYKLDSITCASCPPNSQTSGSNSSRSDCVPLAGFEFGPEGFIQDRNECLYDATNPCVDKDRCVNTQGGAYCNCPDGTIQQPDPGSATRLVIRCTATDNQCPELTAPQNSRLECRKVGELENCTLSCDPGYEFMMDNVTTFPVICGSATGNVWSFPPSYSALPQCLETVFADTYMNGILTYPDSNCDELTQDDKQAAVEQFGNLAETENVCNQNAGYKCEVMRVDTSCRNEGVSVRFDRKKRDAERQREDDNGVVSFSFSFKLALGLDNQTNDKLRTEKHETLLQFESWTRTERLRHLIDTCDLCLEGDQGETMEPQLNVEEVQVACPPGAVHKQNRCVCLPGRRFHRNLYMCLPRRN